MPSLFRRKSDDLVTDSVTEANTRAAKAARGHPVTKSTGTAAAKGNGAAGARSAGAAGAKSAKVTGASGAKSSGAKVAAGKAKATATRPAAGAPAGTGAVPAKATKIGSTRITVKPTEVEADDAAEQARPRGYTASKKELGQATPKRRAGGRVVEPPPANRREAARRMRTKQREARAEARAGAMAGNPDYLPKRDQGPERALVRDIVDGRHSLARGFMPAALLLILVTSSAMPVPVRYIGNTIFYLLILGVLVDCVLLCRRIKKLMRERFPKDPLPPRSYYFYGIMRALAFRKIRMPAPRVKVGDKL